MDKVYTTKSDSRILSYLDEKEFGGWQLLIDRYAPMMYGCIYNLTADEELTGEILENIFMHINTPEIKQQIKISPGIFLFHLTQSLAVKFLKNKKIDPIDCNSELYQNYPLLSLLFCDQVSLETASKKLNITREEAGKQLRGESNQLRLKNAFNKLKN